MPTSSVEKWPVKLSIVKVAASPVAELELFLLTGVMNGAQADTLKERLPILSTLEVKKNQFVLTTLVTRPQLRSAYDVFTPLAKEWRGQYYALTNKFVDGCRPFLES
jgi:hypothetical protein